MHRLVFSFSCVFVFVRLLGSPVTNFVLTSKNSFSKPQKVEFIENKGQLKDQHHQAAPYLLFKAELGNLDVYVTETGLSYVFLKFEEKEPPLFKRKGRETWKVSYERVDLELKGASITKQNIEKSDSSTSSFNYLAYEPQKALHGLRKYARLTIRNVYPGIDWVLYTSSAGGLKYDFVVRPGANYHAIELVYKSKLPVVPDTGGNLLVKTKYGTLEEQAPFSFYTGVTTESPSSFLPLKSNKSNGLVNSHFKFHISGSPADSLQRTLVIDPQLTWSTFFGGPSFEGTYAVTSDNTGNVFSTGYCSGTTNFPLQNSGTFFQSAGSACFINKFNNSGVLLWSTFYGGSGLTFCNALATDNAGNLFLCGGTSSSNFPLVNNNTFFQSAINGSNDAFIAKFDNLGNCTWATFFGGSNGENATSLATDPTGNVFMAGTTSSANFPVLNAGSYFEGTITGSTSGFITKFSNTGTLIWSTYCMGLLSPAICTNTTGDLFVAGSAGTNTLLVFNPGGGAFYQGSYAGGANDGYIHKFSNAGNLLWGTYYGGSGQDNCTSVACDKAGDVFVCGKTSSSNFPLLNAGTFFQSALNSTIANQSDAFLLKFSANGIRQWATYFGGNGNDVFGSFDNLATDSCGNVYLAFETNSDNLPATQACEGGYYDNTLDNAGPVISDIFVARFSNLGNLTWSSYLGGDGNDFRSAIAVDSNNNLFVTGEWTYLTQPASYPLVNPTAQTYSSTFLGTDDVYYARFGSLFPAQNFSYTNSCSNDTSLKLPSTAPGFSLGGVFSSAPGLSLQPQSGKINAAASLPGTYTVNYAIAPCNCPGAQAKLAGSATITILPAPVLSIVSKTLVCVGDKIQLNASGATAYLWNTGSTLASLSTFAPATPQVLNFTLTGTAANGCTAQTTFSAQAQACTYLEELNPQSRISVSPNPSDGNFTINGSRNTTLVLNNTLGQMVSKIVLNVANGYQVSLKQLAPGTYFLYSVDDKTQQLKIVVTD